MRYLKITATMRSMFVAATFHFAFSFYTVSWTRIPFFSLFHLSSYSFSVIIDSRIPCCCFCYVDCLYVRCFENSIELFSLHNIKFIPFFSLFHSLSRFIFFFLINMHQRANNLNARSGSCICVIENKLRCETKQNYWLNERIYKKKRRNEIFSSLSK